MNTNGSEDRIEDHGTSIDGGKNYRVICKYCAKEVRGFNRLKHHLAGVGGDVTACKEVPPDIKEHMRNNLVEKKKERLLKEVGALYHPELPLKRNFVPSSSEPRRCQLKPTKPITLTAMEGNPSPRAPRPDSAPVKTEIEFVPNLPIEGNPSPRAPHPDSAPVKTENEFVPIEGISGSIPFSYVEEPMPNMEGVSGTGYVDKVIKQEAKADTKTTSLAARSIGRFFYEAGIDLTAIKLPSFQKMIDDVIGCGVGYRPPKYDELRGWILHEEVTEANKHVEDVKHSWESTGCSILLDGWTDLKGRSMIGFLVDCPQGTVFLRSVDVSDAVRDVDALFLLFSKVIEEVGVQNVVQVIAHDTSCYMEASGKKLVEKYKAIFWTLCADRCIDTILERIESMEHVKKVLAEAKTITRFIYSHALPLELMKMHIQGTDLVRASNLKSASSFLTLKKLVSEKENVCHMFSSQTWRESSWASRPKGKSICELVEKPSFWSTAEDVLKITDPLLTVLNQISGGGAKAPMGCIYDAMDRAKEVIRINVGGEETKYLPFWTIIDGIWDYFLHNPLHSAGYYLNPSLFYSNDFFVDTEVTNGLLFCIVRMVKDQHTQEQIVQQLDAYRAATGGFAEEMAIAQRTTISPAKWWSLHGGQSPELQRLAIRVLSQTCSGASRFNLGRGQLHATMNMDHIEQQRFHDVDFVRNNLQLWRPPCAATAEVGLEDHLHLMEDWTVEG